MKNSVAGIRTFAQPRPGELKSRPSELNLAHPRLGESTKISLTQARLGDATKIQASPRRKELAWANSTEPEFCRIAKNRKQFAKSILDLNQFSNPISIINYSLLDWFNTPNLYWMVFRA